jgi:hypothetical protein
VSAISRSRGPRSDEEGDLPRLGVLSLFRDGGVRGGLANAFATAAAAAAAAVEVEVEEVEVAAPLSSVPGGGLAGSIVGFGFAGASVGTTPFSGSEEAIFRIVPSSRKKNSGPRLD